MKGSGGLSVFLSSGLQLRFTSTEQMVFPDSGVTSLGCPLFFYLSNKITKRGECFSGGLEENYIGVTCANRIFQSSAPGNRTKLIRCIQVRCALSKDVEATLYRASRFAA
jgi:hypothetical protein